MSKRFLIMTGAGLIVGFAEALIYYNLGANAKTEKFTFQVPRGKELAKNMAMVLVTSLAAAAITDGFEKMLIKPETIPKGLIPA